MVAAAVVVEDHEAQSAGRNCGPDAISDDRLGISTILLREQRAADLSSAPRSADFAAFANPVPPSAY